MEPVLAGLSLLADLSTVGAIVFGVLVGALPGLSSPMAIALLIPFTISMQPAAAIAMFAALYCAGAFGGWITAILIGLFAIGEMLSQARLGDIAYERIRANVIRLPSMDDLRCIKNTILRSSGISTLIGILPAEGATVAVIMGYNEAWRWSPRKEEFGTGVPEGVSGPESANNAATGGAMVPTLALGIPGSTSTAPILGAMIMQGLKPGTYLLQNQTEFLYAIFGAMILANITVPDQRFWDRFGVLNKGGFLDHRSHSRSKDEPEIRVGERTGREGSSEHPPSDTQAVLC